MADGIRKMPVKIKYALNACVFFFLVHIIFGFTLHASDAKVFRVGSYNVENLFDMHHDGTEYPGFVPDSEFGWDNEMLAIKAENISRVIADLGADVLALQEIESMSALNYLRGVLADKGIDYPYGVVTEQDNTAVRCALLSRFPIVSHKEIVVPGRYNRNILQATIEINGIRMVLFVNHWRSRNAPESLRKLSANALFEAVSELPSGMDYIILGDFNANHDEYERLTTDKRLNDTAGKTGINHVLNTIIDGTPVTPDNLMKQTAKRLHYNPWYEVEEMRRWSYLFFGQRRTIDNMLFPQALFDDAGISYMTYSFDTFDPAYLFDGGRIYRWQREDKGRGRHLGEGYSDHLPIYACFIVGGFQDSRIKAPCYPKPVLKSVSELYESKTGNVRYKIENAIVIYKHRDNAVVKQNDDRAVYIYGVAEGLALGSSYTLIVDKLQRYYGNIQITGIAHSEKGCYSDGITELLLNNPTKDISDRSFENEVIGELTGFYEDGWLSYAPGLAIRVVFRNQAHAPYQSGAVIIQNARIGVDKEPVIIIEKRSQIMRLGHGKEMKAGNSPAVSQGHQH